MSFLDLAKKRISVRGYAPTPVPEEKLDAVLEAGRMAPSAKNSQPYHFVVVKSPEAKKALGGAYPKDWFISAPVIIAVCVEPGKAWHRSDGKHYADVDGAIAMDHMTLCATDLGLGTCWIGAFDPALVKKALNLPEGVEPLAMTPLGIPADGGRPKTRKPLSEIVHHEKW
ncbi:MAG: nitroreductase family protein [Kiritimatiellia bacterium]